MRRIWRRDGLLSSPQANPARNPQRRAATPRRTRTVEGGMRGSRAPLAVPAGAEAPARSGRDIAERATAAPLSLGLQRTRALPPRA